MKNDSGECVDINIPRKCSASNMIIYAKDYASIQINIAYVVEATGRLTGTYKFYAIYGDHGRMGDSDYAISRVAIQDGIMKM
ncbi:RPS21 [Cordylochernes scorpioides]|uniref:40S ribosomal protein S21 n=1 Tax=Cordylochernes scorpioides TaxID=51811 RepID=A0ABY6KWK2_9ARAC|nr:RPS21 [Cordylochernes scorpioides]